MSRFRRVNGRVPVTSGDFIFARRIYSHAQRTSQLRLNGRARGGLTIMGFYRQVHSLLASFRRFHKLGTPHTVTPSSHASPRALRAWWRSMSPSTWRKTVAILSYSDRGSRGGHHDRPEFPIYFDSQGDERGEF